MLIFFVVGESSLCANHGVKLTPDSEKIYTKKQVYGRTYPIDSQWVPNLCKYLIFRLLSNFL
jgi:hypothetical protein